MIELRGDQEVEFFVGLDLGQASDYTAMAVLRRRYNEEGGRKEAPYEETLTRELQNFRMKFTPSANVTFSAWRENEHDDLVLATALALWRGEERTVEQEDPEGPLARAIFGRW